MQNTDTVTPFFDGRALQRVSPVAYRRHLRRLRRALIGQFVFVGSLAFFSGVAVGSYVTGPPR